MALADLDYHVKHTTITDAGQADRFEGEFRIAEKTGDSPVPFTLDDLAAACAYLKNQRGVPGTARMGGPVEFALRWTA